MMGKKTTGFIKPTIEQVKAFMIEKKKDWPEEFCQYYAEKFWYSYEKSGWRLSAGRGGPMKSWTAAFFSNWQDLTYQADRDKLRVLQEKVKLIAAKMVEKGQLPLLVGEIGAEMVDGIMAEYLAHATRVGPERLASCYEWLKKNLKLRLSAEQKEIVIGMAASNPEKARATVVQWVFDAMAMKGQNFKTMVKHG